MLLYIASVFVPVRILYPIVHIYIVQRVSPVCRTWGKLEERLGEKTWGKLERGGEICRKVRRVFVGRRGERGGKICRKVFEERLAIDRY